MQKSLVNLFQLSDNQEYVIYRDYDRLMAIAQTKFPKVKLYQVEAAADEAMYA